MSVQYCFTLLACELYLNHESEIFGLSCIFARCAEHLASLDFCGKTLSIQGKKVATNFTRHFFMHVIFFIYFQPSADI